MKEKYEVDDGLFFNFSKLIDICEAQYTVVNEKRVREVITVYKVLKKTVIGDEVKVMYGLYEPCQSMGYVEIIGKSIEVMDTKAFADCGALADSYELYPRIDGTVVMCFGFNDLKVRGE